MPKEIRRCAWPAGNGSMIEYHDKEWGTPLHDDRKLFEFMVLDAFQAGLSWAIVLKKRKAFEKAFHNFNARKIAKYDAKDIKRLLADEGIIRNRAKINATIENAKKFLEAQKEFGSFDRYVWQFTNNKTLNAKRKSLKDLQSKNKESDAMSADMKRRGFRFVGSTICYAFMQAAGMINDHTTDCFRHRECR